MYLAVDVIHWATIGTGLIAAAVGLLSLVGFLGRYWWVFELASHFRSQYFWISLSSALLFAILGRPLAASGSGVVALLNLVLIVPFYQRPVPVDAQARVYRLLWVNVLQPNKCYPKVLALIESTTPDVIAMCETNRTWIQELSPIESRYPYSIHSTRNDHYGIALYSRFPFCSSEIRAFSDKGVPSAMAQLELDGRRLTVIGAHPPPPKGRRNAGYRNQELHNLAQFAAGQEGEVILCGDLNMSPWSPFFRSLLREGGLHNSAHGFGLHPTWPTDRPYLRVPIDHCLVSSKVRVQQHKTGPWIGSDHYPLIVDFALE